MVARSATLELLRSRLHFRPATPSNHARSPVSNFHKIDCLECPPLKIAIPPGMLLFRQRKRALP